MAVIVYVSIFPQCCLIGVHMPISGLLFPLFYWCNSMYMPNARVSVCTVRRPVCWKELLSVNAGPQAPLEALSVDFLNLAIVPGSWLLQGIRSCVKEPYFTIFCCEIVQDRARSCRTW